MWGLSTVYGVECKVNSNKMRLHTAVRTLVKYTAPLARRFLRVKERAGRRAGCGQAAGRLWGRQIWLNTAVWAGFCCFLYILRSFLITHNIHRINANLCTKKV